MASKHQEENKVGGLRIVLINWYMFGVTCILAICLFWVSWYVTQGYNEMIHSADEHIRMDAQADQVRAASEFLTGEARMFVSTADLSHAERYFEEANETRRREAALEELSRQDHVSYEDVEHAVENSRALMVREIYAMKLVCEVYGYPPDRLPAEIREIALSAEDLLLGREEKLDKARELVFGAEYQLAKNEIYGELEEFIEGVLAQTEEEFEAGKVKLLTAVAVQRVILVVLVLLMFLFALSIMLLVVRPLSLHLHNLRKQAPLKLIGAREFRYLARVYNDVYAQKEASVAKETVLKHKAEHDLMTGLLNRISAEEQVRMLMAEREDRGILILLDLDDLKGINDALGHSAGDRAILGIANTLKTHFRGSDVICRLGGDEFMAFLPNAAHSQDAIAASMTALLNKLSEIYIDEESERAIRCSIGCAVQQVSDTYEALFKRADTALYHVKRGSKNSFAFYTPEMKQ